MQYVKDSILQAAWKYAIRNEFDTIIMENNMTGLLAFNSALFLNVLLQTIKLFSQKNKMERLLRVGIATIKAQFPLWAFVHECFNKILSMFYLFERQLYE